MRCFKSNFQGEATSGSHSGFPTPYLLLTSIRSKQVGLAGIKERDFLLRILVKPKELSNLAANAPK